MKIKSISGTIADGRELEDSGHATIVFDTPNGITHEMQLYTAKTNCGAWGETVICSCGMQWRSPMNGCWQWGHQRRESGKLDAEHIEALTQAKEKLW